MKIGIRDKNGLNGEQIQVGKIESEAIVSKFIETSIIKHIYKRITDLKGVDPLYIINDLVYHVDISAFINSFKDDDEKSILQSIIETRLLVSMYSIFGDKEKTDIYVKSLNINELIEQISQNM